MNYLPRKNIFLAALLLSALPACSSLQFNSEKLSLEQHVSTDTTILSRGVQIPVTYVQPESHEKVPLVVMAHGHGGTRHEAGGFNRIADELALAGVASIRMDFSGCGDSTEPFTENNLTNMLADVSNSRSFAIDKLNVDTSRIGILGFSMGARVAMLAADENYQVMVNWAPAGSDNADSMIDFLGGRLSYEEMKAQAITQGYAPFVTSWGQHQQLGPQWFADNETSTPLQVVQNFTGALLVVYGDLDEVIAPRISESVISAAVKASTVERVVIPGGDHGMGLFNGKTEVTDKAVNSTVSFFLEHL